mgnify:FL=1
MLEHCLDHFTTNFRLEPDIFLRIGIGGDLVFWYQYKRQICRKPAHSKIFLLAFSVTTIPQKGRKKIAHFLTQNSNFC